jgi:hypothetical protein
MSISVNELTNKSDAEYLMAPLLALHTASQEEKVLLVFDDIVLHKFKERQVFDLADQPFSPFNLANEIMTRTGIFADGREVTSIVIVDEATQTLQLQKDEDNFINHLESLAD